MGVAEFWLSTKASELFIQAAMLITAILQTVLLVVIVASTLATDDDEFLIPLALQTLYLFAIPVLLAIGFGAKRDPYIYFFSLFGVWGVLIFDLTASIWRTLLGRTTAAESVLFYTSWVLVIVTFFAFVLLAIGAAVNVREWNRNVFQLKEESKSYKDFDWWNRLSRTLYWSNLVSTSLTTVVFWVIVAIFFLTFFGFNASDAYFAWAFAYLLEMPALVTTLIAAGDVNKFPATGTQSAAYILFAAILRAIAALCSTVATIARLVITIDDGAPDAVTLTLVWLQNALGIFVFVVGVAQTIALFVSHSAFKTHLRTFLSRLPKLKKH